MYRTLADMATGDPREALLELAEIEDRHAAHWESLLIEAGIEIPPDPGVLDSVPRSSFPEQGSFRCRQFCPT